MSIIGQFVDATLEPDAVRGNSRLYETGIDDIVPRY